MVIWLTKEVVLAVHSRQIAEHGGSAGIRDEELLESALAQAQAQQLHAYGDPAPDLADLAAALARNRPFVDGNKRTAAACCETFVELNGGTLKADDLELFRQYLALSEGKVLERDFAAWLRERLQLPPRGKAHEPRRPYRVKPRGTRRVGLA